MKVGIHLGGLGGGNEARGIGVHTSELLRKLKLKTENSKLKIEEYDPEEKYDLVHYTVFKPFTFSIPFQKPAKKVVLTIHDLIPLIYPKHYPGGIKGNIIFFIQKLLIKKNIDAIITISETSKKDICRFLGVDPTIVHVIYLAPKKVFKKLENTHEVMQSNWKMEIAKRYHLPESFALYVGDVNYNKNIPGLLEMCKHANIPLVIAGRQAGEIEKEIETGRIDHPELAHLKELNWSNVIRPGFVPDEDLAAIYNLADVYIQPSLYEGFSLPVLEAKACGTWVIATKIQAHVEISERKEKFSWEKTARQTLEVYKHV